MQYKMGDTVIDVNVDEITDEERKVWRCTAFAGNSQLVSADSPYVEDDKIADVEFEFMRLVAWELSNTISRILWGNHTTIEESQN
jgi:hypothetical protein